MGTVGEEAGSPSAQAQELRLREFGLSEYASRAYLALLKLGATEARPVSRLARVPIAKVYSTLDQLAQRGLCTVEAGPPKRFAPVPIETFLENLAAQHLLQARAIAARKEELARLFPMVPGSYADDRGIFQVVRGRRAALDRIRSVVDQASSSILVLGSDNLLERAASLREALAGPTSEGVEARILARLEPTTLAAAQELAAMAQIRMKDVPTQSVSIVTVDAKHAMLAHFVPDDDSPTRGQDVMLYTNEEAIVRALAALVEREWARAPGIEDAAKDPSS